MRAALKTHIQR